MSDLLSIEEAAQEVGKSVATMRWLRTKGMGPRSGKLGRRVVYRRADIDAWIATAFDGEGAR